MNFKIFIVACLFSVALVSSGQTQEVWSLQKCIDYAIKNNIQIKQGEIATTIRKIC